MNTQTIFKLPTDVIFNGKSYFDLEYPYQLILGHLDPSNKRLLIKDEYQQEISVRYFVMREFSLNYKIIAGGSPQNGNMGFMLGQSDEGKILWFVALDEANPVCKLELNEEITAETSSGYCIKVRHLDAQTVDVNIEKVS